MPGAEEGLRAAQSLLVQQASVLEQIAADCDAVKRLADDQLVGVTPPPGEAAVEGMAGSLQRGSSAKLLEKCGELEGTHDRHLQALLPSLRSLDVELRGVQDGEIAAKGALSVRLFHRLRSISQLQSQIAELRNKLHLYASLLERVHMYCSQLLLMRRLPATYHACLAEVARRRQFGQLYARRGHDAAESLASLREEEVGRRDDFMREHGALLPRGMPQLSLLLGERPPYFEIGTNSSESQLISLSHALSLEAGHGDGRDEGFPAAEPPPAAATVPPLTSIDLLADDAAVAMAVAVAPAAARSPAAAEPHSSCSLAPASEPATASAPAASVAAEPATEPAAAEAAPSAAVAAGSEATAGAAAGAPLGGPPAAAARGFGALASGSALGMPPITRSVSEHSSLHKFGFSGLLQGLRGEESSLRPRFAPLASADCLALTQEAVLAGQCSGELSEVGAALEALGTPLEGLSVEVASQLQRRLAQQERAAVVLRAEARAHTTALERAEAALAAERQRADALQRQLESAAEAGGGASGGAPEVRLLIRVQGHESPPGTPPRTASDALPEGTDAGAGADTAGATSPEEAKAVAAAAAAVAAATAAAEATAAAAAAAAAEAAAAAAAAAAEAAALREEVRELEAKHAALLLQQRTLAEEHQLLSSGVHTAMSCLPPPGPIRAGGGEGGASGAGSSGEGESAGGGEEEGAEEADVSVRTAQLRADDLCSSARQAAHANARLGHAMASEREAHKATQTRAQRRLAYLASDLGSQPPTRLLFTAQAASHAPPGGVAFAGLLLPVLRSGLPTHWLSSESIASLRRWCDDEGVPLSKLRAVVGKAVHVSGPQLAGSEGNGQPTNPYNLPAGETYHIVHAEMQLQHHWVAD